MVKYPVKMEVVNLPNKPTKKADTINLKGMRVELIYNDNSREIIDNTKITSSPANGEPIGSNTFIAFSYNYSDNERFEYFLDLTKGSSEVDQSLITTFAGGSWESITKMVEAARIGKFDMQDYWKVGDERPVSMDTEGIFGDTLVILDFNARMSEYSNRSHVIIGNKTASIQCNIPNYPRDTRSFVGTTWRDLDNHDAYTAHYKFKSEMNIYEAFGCNKILTPMNNNKELSKIILINDTAEDSHFLSIYYDYTDKSYF